MVRFPAKAGDFLFSTASLPARGPTQPLIQWVLRALSPRVSRLGMNLTTDVHLVPTLRINGALPPLPHISS